MIPLLGFLQRSKMFFQHRSLRECNCINTGQHLILLRASPVCTGTGQQFKCLNGSGCHQMRTSTQIYKFVLLIERDWLTLFRVLLAKFYLVWLIHFLQLCNGFFWRQFKLSQRNICLYNLFHFCFNFAQIFCRKRLFQIKIIVETGINCRANGKLCSRIQPLYSLCQYVRSGVPEGFLAFQAVKCQNFKGAVCIHYCTQILCLSIDFDTTGCFIQTHSDSLYDLCGGLCRFNFPDTAIF